MDVSGFDQRAEVKINSVSCVRRFGSLRFFAGASAHAVGLDGATVWCQRPLKVVLATICLGCHNEGLQYSNPPDSLGLLDNSKSDSELVSMSISESTLSGGVGLPIWDWASVRKFKFRLKLKAGALSRYSICASASRCCHALALELLELRDDVEDGEAPPVMLFLIRVCRDTGRCDGPCDDSSTDGVGY